MRYLPATAIALAVGAAVCYGFYITHSTSCILGLFGLMSVKHALPDRPKQTDDL